MPWVISIILLLVGIVMQVWFNSQCSGKKSSSVFKIESRVYKRSWVNMIVSWAGIVKE